jgi:hypothetical protein
LSFYLDRSIPAVSDMAELGGFDSPVYVIAINPPPTDSFRPIAEGFVKGRRFELLSNR